MKQKYMISKSDDGKKLVIKEHAEIDKDIYSILSEESYDIKKIRKAIKDGMNALISVVRTQNLYPPKPTILKISEGVINFLNAKDLETVEIFVDDAESIGQESEDFEILDDIEDDENQLDELLDETVNNFDESISIKKIGTSIKVDDNDVIDDNGEA